MQQTLNLLDLPDEILLMILNHMTMLDVIHSLMDTNHRLDRLALDYLYTRHLNLSGSSNIKTQVLTRICDKILPQIHDQIHQLTVEQDSMRDVLSAAEYPKLSSLCLRQFDEEILYQSLTDDLVLRSFLVKQITHLSIGLEQRKENKARVVTSIFPLILSLCDNLIDLNFGDMFPIQKFLTPTFYLQTKQFRSSTLTTLKINVENFADCLLLLDGRLESLSTLMINISFIFEPIIDIGQRKKLPQMKCFSLTSFNDTYGYDSLIVPLLCRMINLEQLTLYLSALRFDSAYIDGIQLYDQFLNCMTRLKTFKFNIRTRIFKYHQLELDLPSNETILHSFTGRNYRQVASYIDPIECKCHVYSLPFDFKYFVELDNAFAGGKFHQVRHLTMHGTGSFEDELFQLVSEDFPNLEHLAVSNPYSQKDNRHTTTSICFPHLRSLTLQYAHYDYVELFILKKFTQLPKLVHLCATYKSLTTITHQFTDDAAKFNFGTLKYLDACEAFVRSKDFNQYFPAL